jgi:hypothetical protein
MRLSTPVGSRNDTQGIDVVGRNGRLRLADRHGSSDHPPSLGDRTVHARIIEQALRDMQAVMRSNLAFTDTKSIRKSFFRPSQARW